VRLIADAGCVVVGGDTVAVSQVLEDPRLQDLRSKVIGEFLAVPDPRRGVLEAACAEAHSARFTIVNA
jgi:hypothetical protein